MRIGPTFLGVASTVFYSAAVMAATVSPTGDQVEVSTSQGFYRIDVANGSQVMVRLSSSASIAYSKTCVVAMRLARVATIQDRPPNDAFVALALFGFARGDQNARRTDDDPLSFTPKVSDLDRSS
jgi:hypothetical protein